jgi:putative peptidoglycan lipid II flippase
MANGLVRAESQHQRIATGFLWVSFFVLIGKLSGAAKEMAVAWRYGVSDTVDAYFFIFNLVNWPVAVWFSVLTVLLVPLVARVRSSEPEMLPRFGGELVGISLAAGALLALLICLAVAWTTVLGASGLKDGAARQASSMVGPLSLLVPLGLVISVISAWTMAHGQHRNTLLEAVPSLTLLVVLILPHGVVPEPLAWGSLVGCALQLLWLGWPLWRARILACPQFSFQSGAWRYFWPGFGVIVAGQAFSSLTSIVDQFFAVSLGSGAISVLNYATRFVTLILGLGAMAISRATLPIFSELSASARGGELHRLAAHWAMVMFILGAFGYAIAWVLAPWGIALLFQRGAFSAADTVQVVSAFRYLGFQVPFYFAGLVLVAYFSAIGRYRIVAFSGVANMIVKASLLCLLVPAYGLVGLCLSTVLMYVFSLGLLLFYYLRLH